MRQQEMDRAIAEGRLTVRTMTAEERAQSDARFAAAADARARGHGRRDGSTPHSPIAADGTV